MGRDLAPGERLVTDETIDGLLIIRKVQRATTDPDDYGLMFNRDGRQIGRFLEPPASTAAQWATIQSGLLAATWSRVAFWSGLMASSGQKKVPKGPQKVAGRGATRGCGTVRR